MKKIFTLFAASVIAIVANAGSTTAKFGSANNSDKDTQVTCPGFTIDGTYVASGNSKVDVYGGDKGMKMRANKTENTLILTVDENTTITALTMGVVTNDAEQTLPIADVLVDGESVALDYPIATYNTTSANGSAVINLTDIKATKTIGIKFNTSDYTAKNVQVFIAGEVTYSDGASVGPVYPKTLDFTLNGEKELAGVTVNQEMDSWEGFESLQITIDGECDADILKFDFTVPEGWDGALRDLTLGGSMTPWTTRSEEDELWFDVNEALQLGFKEGTSIEFPVNGRTNWGTIYLVKGDKIWGSSIDITSTVSKTGSGEIEEPTYPENLVYTINGESRLPGVTVTQAMDQGSLSIDITGETDADEVSLTFGTPEGWDGLMIAAMFADVSNIEFAKTRSEEDWYPIEFAAQMGFVKGNTVTFPVDGEDNWATIALYKGELVYQTTIEVNFDVAKGGGSTSDEPLLPESIKFTTFVDGLTVDQSRDSDDGSIYLEITGTISEDEYSVVLEVPEGWDGFVSKPYFGADVTIEEYNGVGPRKISATDHDWDDIDNYLNDGYKKGNKLTFKPIGNYEFVETFLYKGNQVDYNAYIGITAMVSKARYNVTTSCPDLRVSQEDFEGIGIITVVGECPDDEYTVTVEVPEGYDGFVGYTDLDMAGEIEPLKKILDPEWEPLENVLAGGCKITNTLTFPADGEEHYGQLMPYKGDQVDVINQVNIEVLVTKAGAGGDPEFPRELDITASAAGVEVSQFIDEYNTYVVGVNGESATPTFDVDINVPAGWDGFVIYSWNDNATVNESKINPRKAPKAIDETWEPLEYAWKPIDELLSFGYIKGNSITVTANGEDIDLIAYLYKGDQVETANGIYFEGSVTSTGGSTLPKFPEIFDITPDNWDVEIWQGGVEDMSISGVELTEDEQMIVGLMYPQNAVVFTGETEKETVTATFDLPAGWAGILPIKVSITPYTEDVYNLATRGNEAEFAPLDEYLSIFMSMTSLFDVTAVEPGNPLVFPANGEKQVYICNLYIYDDGTLAGDPEFAGNYVDVNNSFVIVVDVKSKGSSVESIDAIDTNANYYDMNGNKVAKPAKGIYVKVVDGKASKVVVK